MFNRIARGKLIFRIEKLGHRKKVEFFFDFRLDFQKFWNILNVRCHEILRFSSNVAHVAQSVEHVLGKDEVTGSIPVVGSIFNKKQ